MSDEIEKLENEAAKVGQSVELPDGVLDNVVGGDNNAAGSTHVMQLIQDALQKLNDTTKNAVNNIQ